jgi:glycosyltransferase involved in cell wall biosynthesis
VVITKNEAANIQDCLASIAWAAERIVVDAESSDPTADLARAAGAKVIVRPWPGFGAQKNYAMDQVAAEWVLIVDADERIPAPLQTEIQYRIAVWKTGDPVAYEIPQELFLWSVGPSRRSVPRLPNPSLPARPRQIQRRAGA